MLGNNESMTVSQPVEEEMETVPNESESETGVSGAHSLHEQTLQPHGSKGKTVVILLLELGPDAGMLRVSLCVPMQGHHHHIFVY